MIRPTVNFTIGIKTSSGKTPSSTLHTSFPLLPPVSLPPPPPHPPTGWGPRQSHPRALMGSSSGSQRWTVVAAQQSHAASDAARRCVFGCHHRFTSWRPGPPPRPPHPPPHPTQHQPTEERREAARSDVDVNVTRPPCFMSAAAQRSGKIGRQMKKGKRPEN